MELSFTDDENWGGPFYELYVELGPHPASLPLVAPALEALWDHESLDGPYADGDTEPSEQRKAAVTEYVSTEAEHMLGMARLPDGSRASCGCVVHIPDLVAWLSLPQEVHERVEWGPDALEPGTDAYTFYIPYPALDRIYGVDWESEELPTGVERQLEVWLHGIADWIRGRARFAFSAVGPEGSYNPDQLRGT